MHSLSIQLKWEARGWWTGLHRSTAGLAAAQCPENTAFPFSNTQKAQTSESTAATHHKFPPKTEYLGSLVPMRPVTTAPVCMPTRCREQG